MKSLNEISNIYKREQYLDERLFIARYKVYWLSIKKVAQIQAFNFC